MFSTAFLVVIGFTSCCFAGADDSDLVVVPVSMGNENDSLICCHANCNESVIAERMIGIVETDGKWIKEYGSGLIE